MMRYTSDAIRPDSAVMLPSLQLACRHAMFLRRLNLTQAADQALAQRVFLATPEYELDAFGRLPSGDTLQPLQSRFPDSCAPEHRLTFVAFNHEEPIGLAQVALHLPQADTAAITLLAVPSALRKQHIGCEMVERLSRQARRWPGIRTWVLSVTETNAPGQAFWRHCGFHTLRTSIALEGFAHRLITMSRPVKSRPACQHHGATESAADVTARHLFARLR